MLARARAIFPADPERAADEDAPAPAAPAAPPADAGAAGGAAPARSPATDNKALFVDILMRIALPEQQEALKREMREVQQQKVQGVITSAREVLLPRMQKIMGADKWRVATLEYKQAMNRR